MPLDNFPTNNEVPTPEPPNSSPQSVAFDGVKIKDRYRIERELGRGGFGIVYLARDEQLSSRPVVIKVLLERASNDEWFMRKFREERDALSRIDHPGVVGVLDAGEMPDGKPFLAMQYVDGRTLRAALQEEDFPLSRIAEITRKVSQALSAAHDRGVIHRDLKPENIMLQDLGSGEELVKIIDFGISSVLDASASHDPQMTLVAGSSPYMAPEQIMGHPTAQSDVYALGIIAYEMVTGRRPFSPSSPAQMYVLQQGGISAKPRELCAAIPVAAEACILKALSFEGSTRYQRARDFGEEFAAAMQGSEKPVSPAAMPTSVLVNSTTPKPPALEVAHILFMDIIGYSLLSMDRQTQVLQQLQDLVCATAEFRRAQECGELISLPTGDGMALVFFRDPVAPVQCAVELSKARRDYTDIKLRIGIHSGPVYRVADINANRNVAGGGINMAQRVMDSGDDGHILLSRTAAETLSQLSQWAPHIHDLGENEVKHGVKVHLFNLYNDDFGRAELPQKLAAHKSKIALTTASEPPAVAVQSGNKKLVLVAGIIVAIIIGLAAVLLRPGTNTAQPSDATPAVISQPDHQFNYHIEVQRFRDGQPYREPFRLPGEMIFQADYRIRLVISSPRAGHFYILNEGPVLRDGLASFNVLYPGSGESASLTAGQTIQIPAEQEHWIIFDDQEGTEKLWMVWSTGVIPEMEAAKTFGESEHQGVVDDPDIVRSIQAFLNRFESSPPASTTDETNQQTIVAGQGNVIVKLLKLEHH